MVVKVDTPEERLEGRKRKIRAVEIKENEEGEAEKKVKVEVDPEIVQRLEICESFLSSNRSGSVFVLNVAQLFEAILDKNVNTVLIHADFTGWVRTAIVKVLGSKVDDDGFKCLKLGLKVAPTVFEPLLDQVFLSIWSGDGPEFESFLDSFVHTFEKLRRLPKFVAKLLLCLRELKGEDKRVGFVFGKLKDLLSPVISHLAVGQIMDLWKTLEHNLNVECVKKLEEEGRDKRLHTFLGFVVDLYVVFLESVKVVDFSVPLGTVDKAWEGIKRLWEEALGPLGNLIVEARKPITSLLTPFLRLSFSCGQLHGTLVCYNAKYKGTRPCLETVSASASDLSYINAFLDEDKWETIGTHILKTADPASLKTWIELVAQKFVFMKALEKTDNPSLSTHLKAAADYIWKYQNKEDIKLPEETLYLVSQYVDAQKVIEVAAYHVQQLVKNSKFHNEDRFQGLQGKENPLLHFAVVVETLEEIMRRIQKMKLLSKPLKKILKDVLDAEKRVSLILESPWSRLKSGDRSKTREIMTTFVAHVNSLFETPSVLDATGKSSSEEFCPELVMDMINMLGELSLETYPKELKSLVFLCSIVILVAVVEHPSEQEVVHSLVKLITSCGSRYEGETNDVLFGVNWNGVFDWFVKIVDRFKPQDQVELCHTILSNIYLSQSIIEKFEDRLTGSLCCNSDGVDSSDGYILMLVLEYLVESLPNVKKSKTKLHNKLEDHIRLISDTLVPTLSTAENLRRCFIASSVMNSALDVVKEDTKNAYFGILTPLVKKCMKRLKGAELSLTEVQSEGAAAMRFLQSVCSRYATFQEKLPSEFLPKIWKICYTPNILQYEDQLQLRKQSHKAAVSKNFVKHIVESASLSDLELISSSVIETFTVNNTGDARYKELNMAIQVLAEFVDAEIPVEAKAIRKKTVQECLEHIILRSLDWNFMDADCLNRFILPSIQLQTKILRRRTALLKVNALALCLATFSSVELKSVDDLSTFRTVFCALADLLNAFAIHRLDVILFRSHIFQHGFQILLENLCKRSDQKNKLNDRQILQLRTCSHSLERLCQSMKLGQKEFSKVAPYYITVILKQFEAITVYPVVKMPLLNGCYKLLDICDDHRISHLNSLLSVGSKEIFKSIFEQYKKYFKYKGRV